MHIKQHPCIVFSSSKVALCMDQAWGQTPSVDTVETKNASTSTAGSSTSSARHTSSGRAGVRADVLDPVDGAGASCAQLGGGRVRTGTLRRSLGLGSS